MNKHLFSWACLTVVFFCLLAIDYGPLRGAPEIAEENGKITVSGGSRRSIGIQVQDNLDGAPASVPTADPSRGRKCSDCDFHISDIDRL